MLGPPPLPDDHRGTYSDPFLTSLVDYQRRFSDELSTVLSAVVMGAMKDDTLKGKLGSFIDHNRTKIDPTSEEGQDSASLRDIQYLLGYMQRNSAELAGYLGMSRDYLTGVASDLLEIRNVLAHGLYRRGRRDEEREKTEKFIQRGVDFIQRVVARLDAVKNGYEESEDREGWEENEEEDKGEDEEEDAVSMIMSLPCRPVNPDTLFVPVQLSE